jgi:hypothetical protein
LYAFLSRAFVERFNELIFDIFSSLVTRSIIIIVLKLEFKGIRFSFIINFCL